MLLSMDEKYFLKIWLLLSLSLNAVRKVFDMEFSPHKLENTLRNNYDTLKRLRQQKIISKCQWKILYPNKGSVCSSSFDATLMINLLRHVAAIKIPDHLLLNKDFPGAHLGTINYYRNLLVHSVANRLPYQTYSLAWNRLHQAITKLMGSHSLDEDIRRIDVMHIELENIDIQFEINNSLLELKRIRNVYEILGEELRIVKDICYDQVPFNIREQFRTQVLDWQKDDKRYVPTECSEHVQTLVQQRKLTVIIGGPGSGKTAVLRHVALAMKEIGFLVTPITVPNDIIEFFDASKKTLFVIDNFCGKYSLDLQMYDSWVRVIKQITDIPLNNNIKIILACRLQVVLDIRFHFRSIFEFEDCIVNLHKKALTWSEKIKIAKLHDLQIEDNDDQLKQILQSCYCFPLLCSFYKQHNKCYSADIFKYPYDVLKNELEMIFFNSEDGKFCAMVLLVMFDNQLPLTYITVPVKQEVKTIVEHTLTACGLKKDHKIKDDIESLMQSFCSESNGIYHALDLQMFNFLAHFVGEKMTKHLILNASATLINTRCMFVNPSADRESFTFQEYRFVGETEWTTLGKHVILIPPYLERIYFQRMIKDWFNGNINIVFFNKNIFYRSFCSYLFHNSFLRELVNRTDIIDNDTAIIACARFYLNSIPLITLLIVAGAHINHSNIFYRTALHYASDNNDFNSVDVLLKYNADPNMCDNDGCSPLFLACAKGHINIVDRLLASRANLKLRNNEGRSPLFIACKNRHYKLVKKLLKRSADMHK